MDLLLESKPTKREKEEKIKKRHQEKIKKSEKKFEFYSSDLTYLVVDDINSSSSKMQKAKKYGIKIITEKQLEEILS